MARDHITFEDLLNMARRVGVEVVSAPSSHRGQLGKMGTAVGVTLHHTGTPNSVSPTSDYPDYQVVKEGRVGLVNSLSAFGLGRHKGIYVFSEYLSWHAGEWSYAGITDGNGHFLGIEAAGIGDWTPWQIDVYPRLVASILLDLGEGTDMMPRHMDGAMPRGRKTDAANLPAAFPGTVAWYLAHPEQIPVSAPAAPALTPAQIEENELMSASSDILAAITAVKAVADTAAARALQGRPAALIQDDVDGSPTRGTIWSIGPGGVVALTSADEMRAQQNAGLAGELVYIPRQGATEEEIRRAPADLAALKRLNGIPA